MDCQFIIESEYKIVGKDPNYGLAHMDNSIEIIQTWSKGGYFIVKDKVLPIEPGNIFLINGVEMHHSNPDNPETYNRSKLIVDYDFFEKICLMIGFEDFAKENIFAVGGSAFFLNPNSNALRIIDKQFEIASENFKNLSEPCANANIVMSIIQILTNIVSYSEPFGISEKNSTIDMIAKYINENSSDYSCLTIDNICKQIHISPSRASHLFKELTGKSIVQYKNELRIAEAKKLLITTNMKVNEIATVLHFEQCSIFNKYFKKMVGCSPNEYRNLKKSDIIT